MSVGNSENGDNEASKNILELINVFNVLLNIDEEEEDKAEEVEDTKIKNLI